MEGDGTDLDSCAHVYMAEVSYDSSQPTTNVDRVILSGGHVIVPASAYPIEIS